MQKHNFYPSLPAAFEGASAEDLTLKDINDAIDTLGHDYEEFKSLVREELEQVKKNGSADPILSEKVTKMDDAIQKQSDFIESLKSEVEDVVVKHNRTGPGGGDPEEERKELKMAEEFFRQQALRNDKKFDPKVVDLEQYREYKNAWINSIRFEEKLLSADDLKALSIGSDPSGGWWVRTEMSDRVIQKVFETSPIRQIATVETIAGNSLEMVVEDTEAGAGWVGEAQSRPETSAPTIGKKEIFAHEMYAAPRVTQRLLDDAGIDVEGWLARKVGQKMGRLEATAFVSGDGVEKPRGFLTYPAGTSTGQIERETTQTNDAIVFEDLIDLEGKLKVEYRAGARFLMGRTTMATLRKIRARTDLTPDGGDFLWQPSMQAGQPSLLLGYPVTQAEDMPAIADGTLPIAFGNFAEAYTIVDKPGTRVLRDPYTAKPYVILYSTRRVGGDVTNFEAIKLLLIQ